MGGQNGQSRTTHIEKRHRQPIASLFSAHLVSISQCRFIPMMPVGDDQFLVLHLSLNKPDPFVSGDYPDRVFVSVLICQMNVWSSPGDVLQDVIDSLVRICVKHEYL